MKLLKAAWDVIRLVKFAFILAWGLAVYQWTRRTPPRAYQALVVLYCWTNGGVSRLLSWLIGWRRRPYVLEQTEGVLGRPAPVEIAAMAAALQTDGYYIPPQRLPQELCDRLRQFALTCPCRPKLAEPGATLLPFNRAAPRSSLYAFDEQDLFDNPDVQKLCGDLSLLSVAQAYLGCKPVLDMAAMWWSTTGGRADLAQAAQLYHFDMDRIKWLKVFIYLTDVGPDSGPHCFVRGSHRTKPVELRHRGYSRIVDDDIRRFYRDEDLVEMTCPAGTIIFEDTSGFHKGKPLLAGDRLILQLEYTNSLFGGEYQPIRLQPDSPLAQMKVQFPEVLAKCRTAA